MTEKNPPEKNLKEGRKVPNRQKKDDDKFEWKKARGTLLVWILIVVVAWILFKQFSLPEQPEKELSYSQYRKQIEAEQIESAEVIDQEFHGRLRDGTGIVTTLPFIDQKMIAEWDSLKIDYLFREKRTGWLGNLIMNIFPWILFIGIWLYIMRRMQGGGQRGLFSFGKSRAKLMVESKLKVTFKDVAGCDEAKEELNEVIEFLKDPKKFTRLGGRIPKGALLLGPPGTGKTLLARAIAGEANVPFFSMSGADFVEMFVGVGASRVRDLFEQGKKSAPCIIFIDEIDAVGRQRGAGLGGGHDEREQTLNQLLVEMDGFESNEGVILIAATNRPDVLDPALTRPGRFDRQIVVDRPDVRGREGILKVHARNIPLAPDVRLDVLAKGTPGMSGADLANLVNESALLAARRNAEKVFMADFESSKDKVMMGTERKSLLINEEEKRQTAYHEAGHVLVAKMTAGSDPVHKVTIIPRGRALGLTHFLPIDEKHNYSRSYLNLNLIHLLGGRAAERLIFNELSTGAGNDIERATEIASKMVCAWGMSDKIGPVALGRKNEEVFIGRDFFQQRDFSEQTALTVDSEIRGIILKAEHQAEKVIRENIKKLHLLADALLDREILDGSEIDIILKGGKLPPIVPKSEPPVQAPPKPPERKPAFETRTARPNIRDPRNRKAVSTTPADKIQTPVKEKTTARTAPKTRRQTARSMGVASSRDPQNSRPSSRELAKMDTTPTRPPETRTPERPVQVKPDVPAVVKDETAEIKAPTPRRRPHNYRTRIATKPDPEIAPTQAPAQVQAEVPEEKTEKVAARRAPARRRTTPVRRRPKAAPKNETGSEKDGD